MKTERTPINPSDMYFWLGEDAELETLTLKQFEDRIKTYEKILNKNEQQPGG